MITRQWKPLSLLHILWAGSVLTLGLGITILFLTSAIWVQSHVPGDIGVLLWAFAWLSLILTAIWLLDNLED